MTAPAMERLQKILARAGVASRRKAEQYILAGRVSVDGRRVTELGLSVDPRRSKVELDGKRLVAERLVYILLHKPRGVMTTVHDPEGRETVLQYVRGVGVRVVPVGRLDFHTSGALLLTNDGDFASGLMHPSRQVSKVYVTKVAGAVDDEQLERWRQRIVIEGRETQPAEVRRLRFEGDKTWLEVTLKEGRNRQVRRLGEVTGFPVMRLARTAYAGIDCEGLRPGQWRHLSVTELTELKKKFGVPQRVRAPEEGTGRVGAPARRGGAPTPSGAGRKELGAARAERAPRAEAAPRGARAKPRAHGAAPHEGTSGGAPGRGAKPLSGSAPGRGAKPLPGGAPGRGAKPLPGSAPGRGAKPLPGSAPGRGAKPMPGSASGRGAKPAPQPSRGRPQGAAPRAPRRSK